MERYQVFLLRELDSNQRLLRLCPQRTNQLSYLAHLYIAVDILYKCFCRPGRNRTHIYGFGDHYSTIELPTYCISLPCQLIWGLDGHSLCVFVSTKTPTELLQLYLNCWRVTFLFNVEYHPLVSIAISVYFGNKCFLICFI